MLHRECVVYGIIGEDRETVRPGKVVPYRKREMHIMKKWLCFVLTALMLFAAAPVAMAEPITENSILTIVNVKHSANVREQATSNSKKLGELKRGEKVTVTGISGNWSRISYKGDVAYVFIKYVSAAKPDEDIVGKTATIVNCKAWVNIRAKASSNSKKLGTANKGSTWTVQGRSGNWIQVDYSGTSAFIYKRYVKIG